MATESDSKVQRMPTFLTSSSHPPPGRTSSTPSVEENKHGLVLFHDTNQCLREQAKS